VKDVGVNCPTCGTGHVLERRSKKGKLFYGCDQYPTCDFVSWDKPVAKPCPSCAGLMIEKRTRNGNVYQCTKCEHKEEVPEEEFVD
jgi:DNA topoisomerase-1